ncbi:MULTISPECIES: LamG-like jellyroll fold domain-containing protein [unclassified Flavobacterium]|uniref:LamG-like jellyroll fold domain-containing protein n=1 Tax=unclassified Flavobacterium TaxID=196869 RepID=UPI003F93CA64
MKTKLLYLFVVFFIHSFIQAQIIPAQNTVCKNDAVTYSVSNTYTSYKWTITGGTPSSSTNSSVNVVWGNGNRGSISFEGFNGSVSQGVITKTIYIAQQSLVTAPVNKSVYKGKSTDISLDFANKSLLLNGSTDYVKISNSNLINLGVTDFRTVSLWFKANEVNTRQVLYNEGGGTNGFSMYIENGRVYVLAWEGNDAWQAPSQIINTGKWYNIVFVFDKNATDGYHFKGYLDGVNIGSFNEGAKANDGVSAHSGAVEIGANIGSIRFGDNSTSANNYFNGYIDEFKLWNRALTNQEIIGEKDHWLQSPIIDAELDVYINFDNTVADLSDSPSAESGSLNGSPQYDSDAPLLPSILWSPGGATTRTITVSPSNSTTYNYNLKEKLSSNCSQNGSVNVTVVTLPDTDGDGIYDLFDLDNDNDGISDAMENNCNPITGYDAYWPLDNSTNDVSGNNHNVVSGSINYDSGAKKGSNAASFNGVSTYLQYSDGTFLNQAVSYFTYSFWIKPSSLSGIQTLLDEGGGTYGLAIRLNGNVLENSIRSGGASSQVSTSNFVFPDDNSWHHVAMTYNNGDLIMYLDGKASGTLITGFGQLAKHTSNHSFGRSDGDSFGVSDNYYSGLMDEIVYYASALSSADITKLYIDFCDNDGDGIENKFDKDSDGDNCFDANEAYGATVDSNGDGTYGGVVGAGQVDGNGKVLAAAYTSPIKTAGGKSKFQEAVLVTITKAPVSLGLCVGQNALFTAVAAAIVKTTSPPTTTLTELSYKWQLSTNNGISYSDLVGQSGVVASGTQVSLNLTNVTAGMNNYKYKILFSNEANICGAEDFATLTVNPLPTATISGSTTICEGVSTPLTLNFTGKGPWNLSATINGDPVVINNLPSPITFNQSPTVTTEYKLVSVTDANGCMQTDLTSSATVTVVQIPTVTSVTSNSRCGTGTVVLGAVPSSGTINWYIASIGGTSIATGTSFTTPSIATTTSYWVDATSNGCTTGTRTQVTATINPLPNTPGTISGAIMQCPTLTSQTYSIAAVPNATSYNWVVPTGWTITAGAGSTAITVTTGTTGQNGNITVSASNSCGTSGLQTLAVTVGPAKPATPGTITGASTQCPNTVNQVYSIAAVTNATTYNWSVPSGWTITAGAGTNSITVTTGSSTTGNITVSAVNNCGASTAQTLAVGFSQIQVLATLGTVNACYTSLNAAFTAINAGTHKGAITINVFGNTVESLSAVLNASGSGSANYSTILIRPQGGQSRLISGAVTGHMIDLNGADNVTIDGLNNNGNSLTISNVATGASSTVRFINDASGNMITNTTIQGSASTVAYGVLFFSTGTPTIGVGNDNNTISNNVITAAGANLPINAIYSSGTSAAIDNSGNIVSGNAISDYFSPSIASTGVFIAGFNSSWTISGNKLFQSSTRTSTVAVIHRGIQILSTTGVGFDVSNNSIGFATISSTGTSTYTGNIGHSFRAIETSVGTSVASSIQGNIISGINISSSTAIALPGTFSGISVLAGAANIGTDSGNIVGAPIGATAITVTSATTLTNLTGIYSTSTSAVNIQNNSIGGINTGAGSATIGYIFHGIYTAGAAGIYNVSSNTIGSTTTSNSISVGTNGITTTAVCTFNGITNTATGATMSISDNTIQNCSVYGSAASVFSGINTSGTNSAGIFDINNNGIRLGTNTGTGAMTIIGSTSAYATVNINSNIVRSHRRTSTGTFTGISSSGAINTALNITGNQFGNANGGLLTFEVATASALVGINVSGATNASSLTIEDNDFRGITHATQGSSVHTYISNSAATKTQEINNNTFTNLDVNTTGNVIFISNSVVIPVNGSQTVSDNKIVTAFNKGGAGGTVTLFTSTALTTAAGVTVTHQNNDFSNITLTGAATIAGWVHTDAGQSTKSFSDNVFNNWTTGGAAVTGMNINGFGGSSEVISNSFSNINGQGAITGLTIGNSGVANLLSISNNLITNLVSWGTGGTVIGLTSSNPTATILIDGNIINSLSSTATTVNISGVTITATGTNLTASNNTVSNLSATGTATFTGISAASTGTVVIQNNAIHTISTNGIAGSGYTVNGISTSGAAGNFSIVNNTIGTTSANSIKVGTEGSTTAVCVFNGITNTATGNISVNNNTIQNVSVYGTGASTYAGVLNTAAATSVSISNNTITSALNLGNTSGTVRGISISGGTTVGASENTITNLYGNSITTGSVTGITISGGSTVTTFDNMINNLLANALTSGTINGVLISGGATTAAYRNKIYDLTSASAALSTGGVYGVSVTAGTAVTLRNNIVGNLTATAANSTTDVIRGISVTSTTASSNLNVYYNTIHLNAQSSGTNFSTSGIYHTANANSTTATLDLRNNVINNISQYKGSGLTVAFRRSSSAIDNLASTSNNNLYYAGAPSSNNLIYYDAANSDNLLLNYQTRVNPRETASVSEDLITDSKFLSVSGASDDFLHFDNTKTSLAESGGASIAADEIDFDQDPRFGNASYAGAGSAPDIGADEFESTKAQPMGGNYTVGIGGDYESLTRNGGLFADINSRGLQGNIIVKVISDLSEDGLNPLIQWREIGVKNYTATLVPSAAIIRTISGNVSNAMIRLNGADRFIVDGRFSGSGNFITFRNTNTVGTVGSAIRFINGATYNNFKNCTIEAYADATNGVILFSTSNIGGGNSYNSFENCNIIATVGTGTSPVAIYSAGSTGFENNGNTLKNNAIYNFLQRGIDISASGSTAWTISGNSIYNAAVVSSVNFANATDFYGIRISGGSGYTLDGNYIGGSSAQIGGTNAVYGSTTGRVGFYGISMTTSAPFTSSVIKSNTIAGITVNSVPLAANAVTFYGIDLPATGSNIIVGGETSSDGNTIGSSSGNGSISINTSTAALANTSLVRGINSLSSKGNAGVIKNNKIGGIDMINFGITAAVAAPTTFLGIYVTNASAPNILNNSVGLSQTASIRLLTSSQAVATSLTGISIGSLVTAMIVDGNTVQNISKLNTTNTAGTFTGINSVAAANSILTINNNTIKNIYIDSGTTGIVSGITNSSLAGTSTEAHITNNTLDTFTVKAFNVGTGSASYFMGIFNSTAIKTLNITRNTLTNYNTPQTGTGNINFIRNTGAVSTTVNINNNALGTASNPLVTFTGANTGAHIFIYNSGGGASAALSISENDFRGINYTGNNGTGAHTYVFNSATTLTQNISKNTFTNLNVGTSGAITFISNSVALRTNGIQNVNDNKIVTGFFKTVANGAVTFMTSIAPTTLLNATSTHSGNNFSNVTVSGTSAINGLVLTDAGAGLATRVVENNVFDFWSGGTGAITGINVNIISTNNATRLNKINNITSTGSIIGINTGLASTGVGNDNVYNNIISNLTSSTTAANAVTGIAVIAAGNTKSIYNNTIYNLTTGIGVTTGSIRGIAVTGSTLSNIYSNTIYNLNGNNITTGSITGILVSGGTTLSVNQNTIYALAANALTTGSANGIWISAGTTVSAYRNKIYDLSSSSSGVGTGGVYGIQVSGAVANAVYTLRNNLVGDLRANNASSTTDVIRGINLRSTGASSDLNVYFNTIHLNASSSGANFGTTGIYHTVNATPTTAALDLRNNIIHNSSTVNGTALTVAFRRSGALTDNFKTTSNNNLYFGGAPSSKNLIFNDGTNSDQLLNDYKARMGDKDHASVTEDLISTAKFLSLDGSSPQFLHIDPTKANQIESKGTAISGITVDFDGDIRFGSSGYTGNGFAADIGADEFNGVLPAIVWDGGAGTSLWNDAMNWSYDFVPTGTDIVDLSGNDIIDINTAVQIKELTLNNPGLQLTVLKGFSLSVTGNLNLTNGTLNTETVFPSYSGLLTITGGTVGYSALGNQLIAKAPYYNLLLSGSGSKTIPATLTSVINNLELNGETVATIPNNFSVGADLNLNSNAVLTIDADKTLTINGSINNYVGTKGLVLRSNSVGTASLIHNSNNVPATVQRYINGAAEDWHFLSSPVTSQVIAGSPWVPAGTYGNKTGYDLYIWDEPTPCWTYQLNTSVAPTWPTIHPSSSFVVGRGYLYSTQAPNPTKEFIGLLNNGTVAIPVTNTGTSLDAVVRGFNLIGNPYPSSIDWKANSGWSRSNLVPSDAGYDMWIWNPAANNYGVFNSSGSVGTNGVTQFIPPMQGYFVRAATIGNISMNNQVRVNNGASNWLKLKTGKANNLKVRIASNDGYGYDEVLLQFGYTNNQPGALKLYSRKESAPSTYLFDSKKELSVRYLTDTNDNAAVPLYFKAGKNGTYTVNIGNESTSFATLLLEDKQTKTVTNLNENPNYNFKATTKDATDRFILHFSPVIEESKELPARIYYDGSAINVDLKTIEGQTSIRIFDIMGKLIVNKEVDGKMIHQFTMATKNEIYIVVATNNGKTVSRKVLVY